MYESEVITFVAPKKSGWLKKRSKGETATPLSGFTQVSYLCVIKSGVELSLQYQNRKNVGDFVLDEWHMYLLSSGSQCTARMRDGFVVHAVYAHSSKPVPFSCCTPVRAQFWDPVQSCLCTYDCPPPIFCPFSPVWSRVCREVEETLVRPQRRRPVLLHRAAAPGRSASLHYPSRAN